jgi:cytochrome c-type biogenesis protein CcmF
MIQEKRAMFKQLNMVLIILTYDLVIFGTFLTRSGVLSSVHSFAQSAIGPLFFVFIAVTLSASLGLLIHRWSDLKSRQVLTSLLSREGLILFSVLLFLGILVTAFWGVLFPLISEIITGQKVTVGPPFYERATGPLFGGLLFLLALCPLSAWSYFSFRQMGRLLWKPFLISVIGLIGVLSLGVQRWPAVLGFWLIIFVLAVIGFDLYRRLIQGNDQFKFGRLFRKIGRQRRTYGAMIIHIGVVLMALGVVGIEVYQSETQGTISQAEELTLAGYTMVYDRLDVFDTADGRNVARAVVSLSRNGQDLGTLYPRRDFYYDSNQPMTIPGVRSTLRDDFYIVLIDWKEISQQGATFKVYHNPLVRWMWVGAWVFIVGVVIAAWPDSEKNFQEIRRPALIQVKR